MLVPVPVPGKQKSSDICAAFIAGAPADVTGFVFYGVNEGNVAAYRAARGDVYVIDNSAFDCVRGVQFRVTKNRYHHDGQGESDGRRFAALGLTIAAPHTKPGPAMLVEQSPSYMEFVARDPAWLKRYRPNALGAVLRPWNRDKKAAASSLSFDGVGLTVTHSSAAAVESLLAGVPVYVSRMSPCFGVSMEDRLRLFGVLADNQFTLAEMRSGFAWKALNP